MTEKLAKQAKRVEEPEIWKIFQRRGTIQILVLLAQAGGMRPSEIDRSLPYIARQVVGNRLAELTAAGMLDRSAVEGPPVGSFYAVSADGKELAAIAERLNRLAPPADRIQPATSSTRSTGTGSSRVVAMINSPGFQIQRAISFLRVAVSSEALDEDTSKAIQSCLETLELLADSGSFTDAASLIKE